MLAPYSVQKKIFDQNKIDLDARRQDINYVQQFVLLIRISAIRVHQIIHRKYMTDKFTFGNVTALALLIKSVLREL